MERSEDWYGPYQQCLYCGHVIEQALGAAAPEPPPVSGSRGTRGQPMTRGVRL